MSTIKLFKEDIVVRAGFEGNEISALKTCVDAILAVAYSCIQREFIRKQLCNDSKAAWRKSLGLAYELSVIKDYKY